MSVHVMKEGIKDKEQTKSLNMLREAFRAG